MKGGEGEGGVGRGRREGGKHSSASTQRLQLSIPHSMQVKPDWSAHVPGGHRTHVLLPGEPEDRGGVSTVDDTSVCI